MAIERPEELAASRLFARLSGAGDPQHNDDGTRAGQVDYLVMRPDGSAVALEVTQHRDQEMLRLRGSMQGPVWVVEARDLQYCWRVTPEDKRANRTFPLPDYRRLPLELTPRLREIEGAGLRKFSSYHDHLNSRAILELGRLGIREGHVDTNGPAGTLFIEEPDHPAIWVNPAAVNPLVEDHVGYNLAKLRQAVQEGAHEAHLWLWLDPDDWPMACCFRERELPVTAPKVAAEVFAVWVADLDWWSPITVRRIRPGGAWEEIVSPSDGLRLSDLGDEPAGNQP